MKYETKTHEDEEDPGVVPIIEPLRVVLDAQAGARFRLDVPEYDWRGARFEQPRGRILKPISRQTE